MHFVQVKLSAQRRVCRAGPQDAERSEACQCCHPCECLNQFVHVHHRVPTDLMMSWTTRTNCHGHIVTLFTSQEDTSSGILAAELVVFTSCIKRGRIPARRFSVMSSRMLYRLSGGTLIAASLLSIVNSILSDVLYPGNTTPQQYMSLPWLLVSLEACFSSSLSSVS